MHVASVSWLLFLEFNVITKCFYNSIGSTTQKFIFSRQYWVESFLSNCFIHLVNYSKQFHMLKYIIHSHYPHPHVGRSYPLDTCDLLNPSISSLHCPPRWHIPQCTVATTIPHHEHCNELTPLLLVSSGLVHDEYIFHISTSNFYSNGRKFF